MKNKLKGIIPAVASPCDENDKFLEKKFSSLVEYLRSSGVHGFFVCGGAGDGLRMSLTERKSAVEIAVDIAGRYDLSVIAHVGTNNTRDSAELALHAAKTGVDGVSSMPPFNFTQKQLVDYYKEIAQSFGSGVLVYHIPIITHHYPTFDEMLELLDIEGVVGLKMTDWNLSFMKRLRMARPDIVIFSGFDDILCPSLLYGADGGVGMNYNLFPKLFLGIYQAILQGDIAGAMSLQGKFIKYSELQWRLGVVETFEYLMQKRGYGPFCFRRPRSVPDTRILEAIEPELNELVARIEKVGYKG